MRRIIVVLVLCLGMMALWAQGESAIVDTAQLEARNFQVHQEQGYVVGYKVVETDLEVYMSAPTTGWLAVGFNPSRQMKDANIIIAYVRNAEPTIRDDFGTSLTAHSSDLSQGGVDNVTLLDYAEEEGRTSFHFRIPLDSGTPGDRPLVLGNTYPAIWAFGPNNRDDFLTPHIRRGGFQLKL